MKYWNIIVWSLILTLLCTAWLRQQQNNWLQDETILKNTALIKELQDIRKRSSDRWTGTDTENFLIELIRLNPDLKIPDEKLWKGNSRK